jgi:hypothetical protein
MTHVKKTVSICLLAFGLSLPGAALAQGLLANLPVKISVGNGTQLTGSDSSLIGVGVLTPERNKTPISLRLLGTDKAAGVYVKNDLLGKDPLYILLQSPLDGKVNSQLPK